MSFLIKITGLGFLICFINPILKKHSPQTAAAVTVAASSLIFGYILNYVQKVFYELKGISSLFNAGFLYSETIIKVILIAWVCEYSSAIIEDAGEKAVARKIEFAGKIIIFVMIFPLLTQLADSVVSLVR